MLVPLSSGRSLARGGAFRPGPGTRSQYNKASKRTLVAFGTISSVGDEGLIR